MFYGYNNIQLLDITIQDFATALEKKYASGRPIPRLGNVHNVGHEKYLF